MSTNKTVLKRPIPKTGELLPLIGCGTYLGFDAGPERYGALGDVLGRMLDGGGTVVDSSPMYGRSEDVPAR